MLNIFKKGEKEEKDRHITRKCRKLLRKRFLFCCEQLAKEDLPAEERELYEHDIEFITANMPERMIKSIDISGILAAFGSFVAMVVSALISYRLSNKGLYDKRGDSLLNPLNFKK